MKGGLYNPITELSDLSERSHSSLTGILKGTDTLGGYGSYTTVALSPAQPDTNYRVLIRPTADPSAVGEVWISDKATNSFRVNNTGSGKSAFEWAVESF